MNSIYDEINGSWQNETGFAYDKNKEALPGTHPALKDISGELLVRPYMCSECGGSFSYHKIKVLNDEKTCPICEKVCQVVFNWQLAHLLKEPNVPDPQKKVGEINVKRPLFFKELMTLPKKISKKSLWKEKRLAIVNLLEAYELAPEKRKELLKTLKKKLLPKTAEIDGQQEKASLKRKRETEKNIQTNEAKKLKSSEVFPANLFSPADLLAELKSDPHFFKDGISIETLKKAIERRIDKNTFDPSLKALMKEPLRVITEEAYGSRLNSWNVAIIIDQYNKGYKMSIDQRGENQ